MQFGVFLLKIVDFSASPSEDLYHQPHILLQWISNKIIYVYVIINDDKNEVRKDIRNIKFKIIETLISICIKQNTSL